MKKTSVLAMSVLCAVASFGFVAEVNAETMRHDMDEVVIEGQKDVLPGGMVNTTAKLGVLGNKDILEIPYSEMSMTAKTLEAFDDPSQPLANVLANNPSIRNSTSSPMYTDFSMRGINMNGNHMMLNGIPSLFYQFTTPPSHVIDRIDITSGPNAGVNGTSMSNNGTNSGASPAPGTINIVTKKATNEPINRYTQTFSGRSNYGEFIDIGRRFGDNNEWGIRINGEYMEGGLSLKGAEKNEKNLFINVDHFDDNSKTNFFGGYFDLRVNGAQRWFQFNPSAGYDAIAELPDVPDAENNYDFDGTTKYVHGYMFTFNHEEKLDEDWDWFVNVGHSRRSGYKDNQGSALKFDENGDFAGNKFNVHNEIGRNIYAQIGIKGELETGMIDHSVSLAVDRSYAKYWSTSKSYKPAGGGLFGNINGNFGFGDFVLQDVTSANPSWEEVNVGVTIADTMDIGKATLLLAASHKHEHFQGLKANGNNPKTVVNNNILPTYGISYSPVENVALYAGHTESFSRGYLVSNSSGTKYTNDGQVLDPVKSEQNEIGVKYTNAGILTTLSYFDIDEANRYDKFITEVDNPGEDNDYSLYTKVDDGKNNYKGIELTVNGKIADKWTATGGLLYLDAEREKTNGGKKDGYFVAGVAEWSGVLGLEYKPDENWGIVGRANWSDKAYVETYSGSGKYEIPSYFTYDLGVNYKTEFNNIPVRLSAMCYNVTDKDYWMGRGGSSTFGLSMPRTFMVSASFDI